MLTPLECIDFICTRNEAEGLSFIKLGNDTDTLIHKRPDGEVVIAFCGPNSESDVKSFIAFGKETYKDAEIPFRAHSGLLKCWKLIKQDVEDIVESLEPTCITITGHSAGGGIAILCAEDLRYIYPDRKINLITFGAPKVIGHKNWKKIKSRWNGAREFRCGSDMMPCFPFIGYRHVANVTCIGDKPCFLTGFRKSVKYHDIESYSKEIEKINKS